MKTRCGEISMDAAEPRISAGEGRYIDAVYGKIPGFSRRLPVQAEIGPGYVQIKLPQLLVRQYKRSCGSLRFPSVIERNKRIPDHVAKHAANRFNAALRARAVKRAFAGTGSDAPPAFLADACAVVQHTAVGRDFPTEIKGSGRFCRTTRFYRRGFYYRSCPRRPQKKFQTVGFEDSSLLRPRAIRERLFERRFDMKDETGISRLEAEDGRMFAAPVPGKRPVKGFFCGRTA